MTDAQNFAALQRLMTQKLSATGIETAALDARLLLQFVSGLTQTQLALRAEDEVTQSLCERAEEVLAARVAGKPVSKITGRREFWGLVFNVTDAVLDPRPDSETLVAAVLEKLPPDRPQKILDLGTGSGCLALSVLSERPLAEAVAIDKSQDALAVARGNGKELKLDGRIEFRSGDWFENVNERFHLAMSNPPYIETAALSGLAKEVREHDPLSALDGGADGLAPYRIICRHAPRFLEPGGYLAFELGVGQAKAVSALMDDAGFDEAEIRRDLAGHERVILARLTG